MSYATIDDLRSQLGSSRTPEQSAAYAAKMLHKVPDAPVVNREEFILDHCRGKRVLDFGASGRMHDRITDVATSVTGVDRQASEGVIAFDLDDVAQAQLPSVDVDVIVCGELLEHLSNPGWFLTRLRKQYPTVPVVITVPNAFSETARRHMRNGVENVNIDHCAWMSWRTLTTLTARVGYMTKEFNWYGGQDQFSEGLVFVCESVATLACDES